MSVIELLIVSIGLSIDVFVAAVYMGAGFSKISLGQSDHITSIIVHYQDEDSG